MPNHQILQNSSRVNSLPERGSFLERLRRIKITKIVPYLFLLPGFLLYAIFQLVPLVRLFILSFENWNGVSPAKFVWLDNYKTLFSSNAFWNALAHNAWWVVLAEIPIILGLGLAILLHQSRPAGRNIYRTLFFLPYTMSVIVVGIAWKWIYHPDMGPLGPFFRSIGLDFLAQGWLGDSNTALTALAIAGAWVGYGFCMVLFLAGLASVDPMLYDAARVDGANRWQQFRYVTIPGIANTLNVVVLIIFINTVRVFDFVYVTTNGGPIDSTQVLGTLIYDETFVNLRVGYGSSIAVVTLIIIVGASLLYMYLRERRV